MSKRLHADDGPDTAPPDPSGIAAAIRAAAMRARKSVTEGYLASPPSTHLKQAPGVADYPPSARDSNRQIFPSTYYAPLPSPSKRKRPPSDPRHDDDQSITLPPFPLQSPDPAHLTAEPGGDVMDVDSRPMKPLRRSGRIREVTPTRSLFPSETEMNSHQYAEESTNMPPAPLS